MLRRGMENFSNSDGGAKFAHDSDAIQDAIHGTAKIESKQQIEDNRGYQN
jgi:hypothetical protein